MLSTPVLEAASISMTSRDVPSEIVLQRSQCPHGSVVGLSLSKQFNERARILALEVLPVPLGPLKRYAGAMRLLISACFSVAAMASCPIRSLKRCGLYL